MGNFGDMRGVLQDLSRKFQGNHRNTDINETEGKDREDECWRHLWVVGSRFIFVVVEALSPGDSGRGCLFGNVADEESRYLIRGVCGVDRFY